MEVVSFIIFSITVSVNALLGTLVYLRNPKNKIHRYLSLFTLFVILWITTLYFYYILDDHFLVLLLGRLNFAVALFIGFSFFQFVYHFPRQTIHIPKRVRIVLFVLSVFLAVITALTPYIDKDEVIAGSERTVVYGEFYWIYVLNLLVNIGLGVVTLFLKLRREKGISRMQLQYLLLGFAGAFFVSILTNIILPSFFSVYFLQPFGPLSTILVIGSIAYVIVKHQFLDVRLVLARSVAYVFLITALAGLYTGTIFIVSHSFFEGTVSSSQIFIYAIITLFVAITFQPIRHIVEDATESIFFKSNYNSSEVLARLTKILSTTLEIHQVTSLTLKELIETLHIARGAFLLLQRESNTYEIFSLGYDFPPLPRSSFQLFENVSQPIISKDDEIDDRFKMKMIELGADVILPLRVGNVFHGFLLLGEKKSGDIYSSRDLSLLTIFGPEVSVAVQNALSFEKIKRFNVTLSEEVQKATADLRVANEKLKGLDLLKDEFVSLASHELRTPMTAIKSYLWMALAGKGGPLSEKQQYYLERAYNSSDRLIKLVNDMLNISRIESGRIALELDRVDIEKLAKEVYEEVLPRSEELGLSINIYHGINIPPVLADPNKIKEVLINLIGNSLKFTPSGGTITVTFTSDNKFVTVHVSDTGVGIAPDDIPKLFQKFGMIPGSYTVNKNATTGTGLGLYICKAIVELHGGQITVHSNGIGKGTTFSFSLKIFEETDRQLISQARKDQPNNVKELEHTIL